jgi:hypothetical protein
MVSTDAVMKEILDTCYQLYDYLLKCEKCSIVAFSETA